MWAMAKVNIARKNEKKFTNVISSVAKALGLHPELFRVPVAVVLLPEHTTLLEPRGQVAENNDIARIRVYVHAPDDID